MSRLFEVRRDKAGDEYADALTQRPSTFAFSLREGRIGAHPTDGEALQPEIAADFYQAIKQKAEASRERLLNSNAPNRLSSSIDRLIEALGNELSSVRPGILLMRFRSVEADLSAYGSIEGRREIGEDSLSMLADLASSLEDLMGCYPQLAALEAERLALQLQDRDVPSILSHLAEIRNAAKHSDVVDSTAVEALDYGEDTIRDTTETIESPTTRSFELAAAIQARAKLLGQKLLDYRNFAARVIIQVCSYGMTRSKPVREELSGLAQESWVEFKANFPGGVGKAAGKIGEIATLAAFASLVSVMSSPLVGLGTLIVSFNPLGRKAQAVAEKASKSNVRPKDKRNLPRSRAKRGSGKKESASKR